MKKRLRILMVEDVEEDAQLVIRWLEKGGYDVEYSHVENAADLNESLDEKEWDIVIADYSMPSYSGIAALELLQEKGIDLPFIIVSGTIEEDIAVETMKAGAHDYFIKDNLERLVPAIEREMREAEIRRDRKLTNAALRENEERYRTLFEAADEAIFLCKIVDGSLIFEQFNPQALEMFCAKETELVGKTPVDISPPLQPDGRPSGAKAREKIEAALGGKPQHFKWKHQRLNGEAFDAEVTLNRLMFGGEVHIQGLVRDITERKKAEDALREGEEKYRDLVENIIDVIYAVDNKDVITYVSPSVISILGYQPKEILGRPFSDFVHPEDLPRINERFREVLAGKIEPSEYKFLNKSGATLWIRSSSRPIYEGKQPVGLRGVLVDITESRLLQDQLRQAQKMEAIGTLAGGVAHDFNNILGIIVGNTELAMDDVPDWNPAHHNLEEVRKACLRARDMVRQIFAFSRHTDQKLDAVNINPIIRESLRLIRSSIPTTIDIRQNIPRDTGIIKADPTQINQILINLCTNAAHAMGDNGGVLEVGLENAELNEETVTRYPNLSPGRYVRLWVKDTGHGIEPDHLERIFDPYFTTKDVDEGTGMGLAVVHGIVKNHDGAIRAWSEPGKGTTFEVLFPIVGSDVEPRKKTYEPIPKGNERILFVDDERLMTETVKTMLERLGYHVNAKMSSVDALDLFREDPHSFDLVITDMTMPKMTGDQLTKALLQIRADMPIILCTGHSNRIDEEKAMELGVRAFVLKPIVVREMAEAIRRVLDA